MSFGYAIDGQSGDCLEVERDDHGSRGSAGVMEDACSLSNAYNLVSESDIISVSVGGGLSDCVVK